jgi:hypothetical protein
MLIASKKKAPFRGFRFVARQTGNLLNRQHVNPLALPVEPVIVHNAVDQGKQREIPAHADISPGVNARTQLADDDIACSHGFSAEDFDPTPLPLAIAPVTGASSSFLMCHISFLFLAVDSGDSEGGLMLAMASLTTVTLASFLLKNENLLGFALADNLAGHRGVLDQRRADFRIAIAANEQNVPQGYLFAHLASKLLDPDEIPFGHAVLLSTSFNDCISHCFS